MRAGGRHIGVGVGIPGDGALRAAIEWQPTDISGAILWLRADLGITLNGSNISAWADQSGAANDATQAVAGKQPLWVAGGFSGNRPCARFDGVDDSMTLAALDMSSSSGATMFLAIKSITGVGTGAWFEVRVNISAAPGLMMGQAFFDPQGEEFGSKFSGTIYGAITATSLNTDPHYYCGRVDSTLPAANEHTLRRDGATLSTAYSSGPLEQTGNLGNTGHSIGGRDDSGLFANVDIAEIIIYGRAISDAERNLVEAYLAARYSI